jgi:L-ribulose-5-phosphate 3-epimerase
VLSEPIIAGAPIERRIEISKSYRIGLYEKAMPKDLSLSEKLEETARAGFDYMEISIDETDEKLARLKSSRAQRRALIDAMSDAGIACDSMCLSGHRKYPLGSADAATRRRGMQIMSDAIDLAADLGIRIIQLAGYDVYYEESTEATRRLFEENLGSSAELAARHGVLLAFETMETELMNTVTKAMSFVRLVDSPYLQVYPDIGNITNAALAHGADVIEDLRTGKGHIVAVHLKETLPGKFREIPYGTGHVDFDSCIWTARELGVMMFVAEFWHLPGQDWRGEIEKARAFLAPKLDACYGGAS